MALGNPLICGDTLKDGAFDALSHLGGKLAGKNRAGFARIKILGRIKKCRSRAIFLFFFGADSNMYMIYTGDEMDLLLIRGRNTRITF